MQQILIWRDSGSYLPFQGAFQSTRHLLYQAVLLMECSFLGFVWGGLAFCCRDKGSLVWMSSWYLFGCVCLMFSLYFHLWTEMAVEGTYFSYERFSRGLAFEKAFQSTGPLIYQTILLKERCFLVLQFGFCCRDLGFSVFSSLIKWRLARNRKSNCSFFLSKFLCIPTCLFPDVPNNQAFVYQTFMLLERIIDASRRFGFGCRDWGFSDL